MIRLGVLVSHTGTNFQAIIDACRSGRLHATPVIAISNNSRSLGLSRARDAGVATAHLSTVTHPDPDDLDQAMLDVLTAHSVDLVVTAGYMKRLGLRTLCHYAGKIINVHPSLLPKYGGQGMYGMNVHNAVIKNGDQETGITIHWVDEQYDTGPIISQLTIPVLADDSATTLAARVLPMEHELLVDTLVKLTSKAPKAPP